MHYKFLAYGHPNILGTHKTTLEFTKDNEVSLKGNCIIGVKADFDLSKIKKLIEKTKDKNIKITIQLISKNKEYKKFQEIISAELNPSFNSNKELVIRKTDFVSERTFVIRADKAAFELDRMLILFLKEKENRIDIGIESRH
ncbi:MAG: DUF371 domain-containing protein [Nanoarchaeota archaeon]|nr:DUF371 domain-containing protein [Nanoarchaeota archaeon]